MKKLLSILSTACLLLLFSAFIPAGARNTFINGTQSDIVIVYKSTLIDLQKPVVVRRGSGLQMTGDSGDLLSFAVTYSSGKVMNYSSTAISRIESSSHLKEGVWWLTDNRVEFISTKEALIRKKRVFGRW